MTLFFLDIGSPDAAGLGGGGGGGGSLAWSATDHSVNITISSDSLTATGNSTGTGFSVARGVVGHSTGKWCLEMTDTVAGTDACFGFATASAPKEPFAVPGFAGPDGLSWRTNGVVFVNGGSLTVSQPAQGLPKRIVVNFDIGKVWLLDADGLWNGSSTDDPDTNTGGISFPTGAVFYPATAINVGPGSAVDLNINPTTLVVGGSAWGGGSSGTQTLAWDTSANDWGDATHITTASESNTVLTANNLNQWTRQVTEVVTGGDDYVEFELISIDNRSVFFTLLAGSGFDAAVWNFGSPTQSTAVACDGTLVNNYAANGLNTATSDLRPAMVDGAVWGVYYRGSNGKLLLTPDNVNFYGSGGVYTGDPSTIIDAHGFDNTGHAGDGTDLRFGMSATFGAMSIRVRGGSNTVRTPLSGFTALP